VNVRIIAATNTNLALEVNEGRFREDLYYRSERPSARRGAPAGAGADILLLFDHFLEYFSHDLSVSILWWRARRGTSAALQVPGNVRELRNVVQRLMLNCNGRITAKEISDPMILRNHCSGKDVTNIDDLASGQVLPLREMERIFRTRYFKYVAAFRARTPMPRKSWGCSLKFLQNVQELGINSRR